MFMAGQAYLGCCIYESIRLTHSTHCPLNDRLRSSCRIAHNLAQSGLYESAAQALDVAEQDVRGVLKPEQRVRAFKALVQLKKHLCM